MPIQPTPKFLENAAGFAGINGGNPAAPIWFCGIEYGTDRQDAHLDDPEVRLPPGATFPCWNDAFIQQSGGWEKAVTWSYIQKMARVAVAFHDGVQPTLPEVKRYIRYHVLQPGPAGSLCQLNLYPVPFNRADDSGFEPMHQQLTGFPNKVMYKAWCMEHRFPFLRGIVRDHQPAVLVCTGSSFASDFRLAFLGPERTYEEGRRLSSEPGITVSDLVGGVVLHWINDRTLLAITPFLGQGGLMANADFLALGLALRAQVRAAGR